MAYANSEFDITKDGKVMITDPETGQKIPIKLLLGKKNIRIDNSLLYSILLFGTLDDEQLNAFLQINGKKLTQNDKIAHYLYSQASKNDVQAIKMLVDMNLEIAKRDKTTIVNFSQNEQIANKADSILERLEKELDNITEAQVTENKTSENLGATKNLPPTT